MTGFNEANTVEAYLYDLLSGAAKPVAINVAQEPENNYGSANKGLGWCRIASVDFPRQTQEVLVEKWVRDALIEATFIDKADQNKTKVNRQVDGAATGKSGNCAWASSDWKYCSSSVTKRAVCWGGSKRLPSRMR